MAPVTSTSSTSDSSAVYIHDEIQRLLQMSTEDRRKEQARRLLVRVPFENTVLHMHLHGDVPENIQKAMYDIMAGELSLYAEGWPLHLCDDLMQDTAEVDTYLCFNSGSNLNVGDMYDIADQVAEKQNFVAKIDSIGLLTEAEYIESLPDNPMDTCAILDKFDDTLQTLAGDLLSEKALRYRQIVGEYLGPI